MRIGKSGIAVSAAIGVLTLVVPAVAQDTPGARQDKTSARSSSTKTLAAWQPFGSEDPQSVEETFFRLGRDFAGTNGVGAQRLGHVPVWPRGELKFGKIRILPTFRQAAEWQSNFYHEPQSNNPAVANRKSRNHTWTHISQLGVLADTMLSGGRTRVAVSATGTWNVRYNDNDKDDFEADASVAIRHRFNSSMWGSVGFGYDRESDPTAETEVTTRFKRDQKRVALNLGFDDDPLFKSKLRYLISASVRDFDTSEDGFEEYARTESEIAIKASYPVWRQNTRLFGRARWTHLNKDGDRLNDGNVLGFDFGLEGAIPLAKGESRGLRGEISFGFDSGDYENGTYHDPDSPRTGNNELVRDDNTRNTNLAVRAALQYMISSRASADLRYVRGQQFSFKGNYQIVDRVELTYTQNLTRRIVGRVAAFYEHTDPSGLRSQQPVDGRNTNTPHHRNTNRYGIGFGVRYPLEDWVDLDLSVDGERRIGEPEDSYTNYRGVLGVTIHLGGLEMPERLRGLTGGGSN